MGTGRIQIDRRFNASRLPLLKGRKRGPPMLDWFSCPAGERVLGKVAARGPSAGFIQVP
jgi:hypothetical protein